MKKYPLLSYFILTYLGTWIIALLCFLFPAPVESVFGKINVYNPLYFLAVYMPSLSALIITWRGYGLKGCKDILKRTVQWEKGLPWFLFLVFFFTGDLFIMRVTSPLWHAEVPAVTYQWFMFLPMAIFYLFADAGPIGEELGWSGIALPLLQRRFNIVISSIVLGIIWALWHTPAFFIASLNQSAYGFLGFIFCLTCLRVFMAAVFNVSNGSILAVIVVHWFNNLDTYLHITGSSVIASLISGCIYLFAAMIIIFTIKPKPFRNPIPSWNNDNVRSTQKDSVKNLKS